MAGSVLIRTFSFQINISAKMKVSASKSATSPSCKTLVVSKPDRKQIHTIRPHIPEHTLALHKKLSAFRQHCVSRQTFADAAQIQ